MSNDARTTYLVFDLETIPDGELLIRTRYPEEGLDPEGAILRASIEAREKSGSDFLPITFHLPIALCVAKVGADFRLQAVQNLDAPRYRPGEIVAQFWKGFSHYQPRLVTFNGRAFDIPVLEMGAFRYGIAVPLHFAEKYGPRYRYGEAHIDLLDFMTNFGTTRLAGGLNLLAKLMGLPGKMGIQGADVYDYYRQGRVQEINDYCCHDVLDTYFVFLRTRVLTGELTLTDERRLAHDARDWITEQSATVPHLKQYLEHWGEGNPWP